MGFSALCMFIQMEHYKLDWHRFNLRQRLAGRSPITAEEFEKKTGMGLLNKFSLTCFNAIHKIQLLQ